MEGSARQGQTARRAHAGGVHLRRTSGNGALRSTGVRWDEEKGYFDLDVNPHFVAQVREWFDPDETVMLMCRSGGRSAMAVNLLVQAGYTDAWNITDGMEGDMDDGKRTKNGWKNANLPWTYEVNPERMCLPADEPVSIKTEV
jgi:rhodanese-related sulfurtransferase